MKVVDFNEYKEKSELKDMCQEVVNEIIRRRKEENYIYRTSDMKDIADEIIKNTGNYDTTIIPVVSIAKQMNFTTYQRKLFYFFSGIIAINRKYQKKYSTDHIIFTNKRINPSQQRFIIAHVLAHFLFDYEHNSKPYCNTYIKNLHNTESERRANAFAANLLMPKESFIKEYYNALKINKDPIFIMFYLSDKFQSPRKAVIKRILEVLSDD